jgi:hypothetical protein
MATFELWNVESGNLLGSFATEETALVAVREAIQRNGESYAEALALGREGSRGQSMVVASGRQLVDRVTQWERQHADARLPTGTSVRERRRSD